MFKSKLNCRVMMELPKSSSKSSGEAGNLAKLAFERRGYGGGHTSGLRRDKTFAPESWVIKPG